MKQTLRILVLALSLLACYSVSRAQQAVTIEHTEKRTIRSQKIGQTYDLLISLPAEYATFDKKYPVLYVLDGWHFPLMAFLQDNNTFSGRMPPVIIVNISHGDIPWMQVRPIRSRDLTPTASPREPGSGGAALFLDFFEHELIPFIDKTYRTNTGDRGLLGHSYGGVFALYALEERPDLFQRIVAASPATALFHNAIFDAAKLRSIKAHVRLDLSAGEQETGEGSVVKETTEFAKMLDQLKPSGVQHRSTIYPGENHSSVRLLSFPSGLYWVYADSKQK
jgi:predicted alpha/beta superfamily hydrolase